MDSAQELLFGSFPRRVGTPNQFWVFNEAQFDRFVDTVCGVRNAYSTVSHLPLDGAEVCDKVLFDLDGEKSAFPDDAEADERVQMMRSDAELTETVLGTVCDEAQDLTRASRDDGIPVVGVFSGFGLHVHQLYQPTDDPQVPMTTCAARYIDRLDLQTADWKVVGDSQRICRVPNVERATHRTGRQQTVKDGRPTGLWTVPLTADELEEVNPQMLLEESTGPRRIDTEYADERPQMPLWEEYRDQSQGDAEVPQRPVDGRTEEIEGADIEGLLKEMIKMPCMVERLAQPNPEHEVRLNGAVMLYNCGLRPSQVEWLYRQLGWVDYDPEVTLSHLEHIYSNQYSDMSCQTIREKRLCTRADDPRSCECYGWSGGQPEW